MHKEIHVLFFFWLGRNRLLRCVFSAHTCPFTAGISPSYSHRLPPHKPFVCIFWHTFFWFCLAPSISLFCSPHPLHNSIEKFIKLYTFLLLMCIYEKFFTVTKVHGYKIISVQRLASSQFLPNPPTTRHQSLGNQEVYGPNTQPVP